MRSLCLVVMSAVLLCACPWALFADGEKKPSAEDISKLIDQLGDRKYAVREAATASLRTLGAQALSALEEAKESDDPEVSTRSIKLITLIKTDLAEASARRQLGADPAKALKQYGGSAATEAAVMQALAWLARNQAESGKWDAAAHGGKLAWVDAGVTGLAMMALIGRGSTHRGGPYKEQVKRAARWMLKNQAADGLIGQRNGHYMYTHAIATLALVELYAKTKSPLISGAATKGVDYLIKARNPGMAWRYSPLCGDNDVSVTVWALDAIFKAQLYGLRVQGGAAAMKDSLTFLRGVTAPGTHITGYKSAPPRGWVMPTSSRFMNAAIGVNTAASHKANHTPTAIAGYMRAIGKVRAQDPVQLGAANAVSNMSPLWAQPGGRMNPNDMYYWYHGTQFLFQVGGQPWARWNRAMKAALKQGQIDQGDARGSWPPEGAWGFAGGRAYSTAMGALILESYYRQPRFFQKPPPVEEKEQDAKKDEEKKDK